MQLTFKTDLANDVLEIISTTPNIRQVKVRQTQSNGSWISRVDITTGDNFKVYILGNKIGFQLDILEGSHLLYSGNEVEHHLYYDGKKAKSISIADFTKVKVEQQTRTSKMRVNKHRLIWDNLQVFAIHFYSEQPSISEQERVKEILKLIGNQILTCGQCRVHYWKFIDEYKIPYDDVLKTKETFKSFVLDLKNDVNRKRGQPQFTPEETVQYYHDVDQWINKLKNSNIATLHESFAKGDINSFFRQLSKLQLESY